MTGYTVNFMTYFIICSLVVLAGTVGSLIYGIKRHRKGFVALSVCLSLLLAGAWFLLGFFLTRM